MSGFLRKESAPSVETLCSMKKKCSRNSQLLRKFKREKKKKKQVSFSTYLIKGPSNINTDEGMGSVQGG